MLVAIIISVFFIFFPLFLNFELIYENNNLTYNIKLFNLKIFFGKIIFRKEKIIIKTNKKEKALNYKDIFIDENVLSKLLDFKILKIDSNISIGIKNIELIYTLGNIFYILNNIFCKNINMGKKYLKINNNITLYPDIYMLNFNIKIKILLNLFVVLMSLFKKLGNKNYERKK